MKKVIAVFDSLKFTVSTSEYAIYMAELMKAHLVGVFLEDVSYTSYKIFELVDSEGGAVKKQEGLDMKDESTRKHSVEIFEAACRKAKLNYSVHHDRHYAIDELLHESIYSDLLIINSGETFSHYEEKIPTHFIQHVLAESHCPVLIVPEKYKPFEKVLLLYDGSVSSVYSIKMFSYVFRSLENLPVEVLSVKNQNESLNLPDNKLMKEFMKRHCPKATYTILKGEASAEILSYLFSENQDVLVVAGAYSRSAISRLLDESMADKISKNFNLPMFIAHD